MYSFGIKIDSHSKSATDLLSPRFDVFDVTSNWNVALNKQNKKKKQKSSHSKAQETINRILNDRMGDWPQDVYIPKTSSHKALWWKNKYPNLKGSKENYFIDRHLIFNFSWNFFFCSN